MKNSFLPTPTESFQIPTKASQFMKLEQGENEFRILSSLVEGFVFFTEDNKPIRRRIERDKDGAVIKSSEFSREELIQLKARKEKGVIESPKYFWLFLVYNVKLKKFQVLELTQQKVIKTMTEYLKKEDWSEPSTYNFTITKTGSSLDTSYTVTTSVPKKLPQEVLDTLEGLVYNLDNIFEGGYPFD